MRIHLPFARLISSATLLYNSASDTTSFSATDVSSVLPELPSGSRRIYICRHGETEWNAAGRIQGRRDLPLNQAGRSQAASLAQCLAGAPIELVVSSHMERAEETAQLVATKHEALRVVSPKLREMCFGDFEGVSLQQDQNLRLWFEELKQKMVHDTNVSWPSGESPADAQRRCVTGLEQILSDFNEAHHICLVGHGKTNKILMSALLREHWPVASQLVLASQQGNSCINVLDVDGENRWTLRLLNFLDHIDTVWQ